MTLTRERPKDQRPSPRGVLTRRLEGPRARLHRPETPAAREQADIGSMGGPVTPRGQIRKFVR